MEIEYIELRIRGRNYECAILDYRGSKEFLCQTYRHPEYCGWISKERLEDAMVRNDHAHRCCNVHGRRLIAATGEGLTPEQLAESREKQRVHGKTFLACPHSGCDVGLWSGSSSQPASQELRDIRSKVFHEFRENRHALLERADREKIGGLLGYVPIGMLNMRECLTLLGLEAAEIIEEEPAIADVRRSLVLPPRAVELD